MQISQHLAAAPSQPHTIEFIVPPNQLFAIAGDRFMNGLQVLDLEDPSMLPDAMTAEVAMREAESGVRMLRSALVPTTAFTQRRQAATAMHSALEAIRQLQYYQNAVTSHGDGSIPRSSVSYEIASRYEASRDALITAMSSIA